MKIYYSLAIIALLSIYLFQCKAQKEDKSSGHNEVHNHKSHDHNNGEEKKHEHPYMSTLTEVDTMKADGLNLIFYSYFKLRDALSMDDRTKAADYAGSMYRVIIKVNKDDLSLKTKTKWQSRESLIKESVVKIANSADKIEIQRSYMSQLSLNLLELMKTSKLENSVYLFYCPSSNNRISGNWISNENNLDKNPYQNNILEPCGFLIETVN